MAIKRKFEPEHKEMANRIGVGLIEIKSGGECHEILTPQYHSPIDTLLLRTIEKLGYYRCSLCGTITETEGYTKKIKEATDKEKAFYYRNIIHDGDDRRRLLFTKNPTPRSMGYDLRYMYCKFRIG